LHLMNSPEVIDKIQHRRGLARRLAESALPAERVIEELCLATLSRPPQPEEAALLAEAFGQSENRRAAAEDILWALLNSKEFLYNH